MPRRRTRSPEPADPQVELPPADELERLKLSPEVAWYCLSRGYELPDCVPKWKTAEPRNAPGAVFDPARVDRVLAAFAQLRHTQGRWAGRPLRPDGWQVAHILAPVFGWVAWDEDAEAHVRIIRELYVDVPRKNGKSTLIGGICLYMACADGEAGAQVLTGATTKDQAQFVFAPIKLLAETSPGLKPFVRALAGAVLHPATGSYVKVISNVADAQHGANIHCGAVDELHVHKSADLVEVLETGTGSRTQPLMVFITTADAGKPNTIYARKRHLVEQVARGALKNHSLLGMVFAADDEADPFTEETQRSANPGYGVSPTRAYLRAAAEKAQQSPADLAAYLRLHLGRRTRQQTKYFTLASWDANAGMVDERRLRGREAYGGLDLASTSDLLALCWLFPDDERGGYDALWRLWTPEANLEALDARTAKGASEWHREGLLRLTSGNVVDYDLVEAQINADRELFDVRSIGYDPWNSSQLTNNLMAADAPLVKIRQGFGTLSPPTKELQRLLLQGNEERPLVRHGGHRALRWMLDNVAIDMDAAGNVKPDKANSADKIDGVSALVDALAEAMTRQPPKKSAYDDGGDLMVV